MKTSTLYALWAVACLIVGLVLGSTYTQGAQVNLDTIKNITLTLMLGNFVYLVFGYFSNLRSENE